jgi:hypothetical protein
MPSAKAVDPAVVTRTGNIKNIKRRFIMALSFGVV